MLHHNMFVSCLATDTLDLGCFLPTAGGGIYNVRLPGITKKTVCSNRADRFYDLGWHFSYTDFSF